jgi:N-acetylneuraminic acid mutarotase
MRAGGEFCDGEHTQVFNELFRWNVEKNEWKCIESLNTPPPRCSHQAVYFKEKVYVFGGEYATLDQFHHYRYKI